MLLCMPGMGHIEYIIKTAQQGKFSYQDYFIESITVNCPRRVYLASGDENRMILRLGA